MTDREFWLAMARGIERGGPIGWNRDSHRWGDDRVACGLCYAVGVCYNAGVVSGAQYNRLLIQLRNNKPRGVGGYYYPTNARGDALRARLCRRIAGKVL